MIQASVSRSWLKATTLGLSVLFPTLAVCSLGTPLPIPHGVWDTVYVVRQDNGSQRSVDFLLNSPTGPVDGHLDMDIPAGLFQATFSLRGANAPMDVNLSTISTNPQVASLEIVVGSLGTIAFRLTPDGPTVTGSTIQDCQALASYPTLRAIEGVMIQAENVLLSTTVTQVPAAIGMMTFFGITGPQLVASCQSAMGPLMGWCEQSVWEDDCRECCEGLAEVIGGAAGGVCAVLAGAACAPGIVTAVACGAVAGAVCAAPSHIVLQKCYADCDPLPQKPGDGGACGSGGTCADTCPIDQIIPGTCRSGFVCCAPQRP